MEDTFNFFLPSLLSNELIEDDSSHYSFLTFARPEISEAARIIVRSIGQNGNQINIESKKRVKVLMEFFGVSLSLPIPDCSIMSTAIDIYGNWLEDSKLFGNSERQNKYLRRIVKQISNPFAFRNPDSQDNMTNNFIPLLSRILGLFKTLAMKRGNELEDKTWLVLLNTILGVSDCVFKFNYSNYVPIEKVSNLKQECADTVFSIMLHCGNENMNDWHRFIKYCCSWCDDIDYVVVWNKYINMLFKFLNYRIYKLKIEKDPIMGGKYSESNKISDKMVSFVFHNILRSMDHLKTTKTPELLTGLSSAINEAKNTALSIATICNKGFMKLKYSAKSFLKLFGPFLTFAGDLPEAFDEAIFIQVETILNVLSFFDLTGTEDFAKKAISYLIQKVNSQHMLNMTSFFYHAVFSFSQNPSLVPFISDNVLKRIPTFNPSMRSRLGDNFFDSFVALFISTGETCRFKFDIVNAAFESAWKITTGLQHRFKLLCFATNNGIDVFQKMNDYFKNANFQSISREWCYGSALLILFGALIRSKPNLITRVLDLGMIPTILASVHNSDLKARSGYDRIVISALQMLMSIIEWAPSAFKYSDCVTAFFEFINYLLIELKTESTDPKVTLWHQKRKRIINNLINTVLNRVSIHIPAIEHYSRKLYSSPLISEQSVIESLGLKEYSINYFTINNKILLSFIEGPNRDEPLAFVSRGPFGKAVFKVNDDYTCGAPTPLLSTEVKPSELPESTFITPSSLPVHGDPAKNAPLCSMEALINADSTIKGLFGQYYSKWLDWNKYGYYLPFGEKAPYQRLRAIDFLITMGIADNENSNDVRAQLNIEAVKSVIERFDKLDTPNVVMVPIKHVLPSDKDLSWNPSLFQRATPLMQKFLRDIGEPLDISGEAAEMQELPSFRTTVPVIPVLSSFAAFVTPTMASDSTGAQAIFSSYDTSFVKIVFNESSFNLQIEPETKSNSFVFIVKPTIEGLYHVWLLQKPDDVISSLGFEQTVTAKTLAYNISICIEQCLPSIYKKLSPSTVKSRKELIKELCKEEKDPMFAPMATGRVQQ